MIGQKIGRLTVLMKAATDPKWGRSRWLCMCDCGTSTVAYGRTLRKSSMPSCGCAQAAKVSRTMRKYNCLQDYLDNTTTNGECMEWNGSLTRNGYPTAGTYNPVRVEKRPAAVHRRVFFEVNGYYPRVVMHTCDNRKCINPAHLVGGSHKDNSQDALKKGRPNRGRNKYWVEYGGRIVGLAEYSRLTGIPMATLQWRARRGKLALVKDYEW